MNQVFVRSEQLADKIHDIKLHIPEWKVLFAVDGKMSVPELAQFLEMDQAEAESALSRLQEMQLIESEGGAEGPVEEIREAASGITALDETFEEFERVESSEPPEAETMEEEQPESTGPEEPEFTEEQELELPEEQERELSEEQEPELTGEDEGGSSEQQEPDLSEQGEAASDFRDEVDRAFAAAEAEEEVPEEPAEQELLQADEIAEEDETEPDSPEEELSEEEISEEDLAGKFEELKLDDDTLEEEETEETEQDLDSLINDLLKEESFADEGEEGPKILDDEEMAEWESDEPTDLIEEPERETELPDVETEIPAETEEEAVETSEEAEVEESTEEQPEESEEQEVIPAAPEGQKTILVVDDSIVIRKMVEIALENENYNVVSVGTGKEAFAYLDEKEPAMVILDIMLPDVNGLDILKTIKSSSQIPVVMLSAKDTPKETSKAKELGANDFIPKPFRDEELINKIHELIGQ
ncbi:MAG: response regulator [Calditrichaeota bacterium]|nr:response regulator [Calditrichota bacterium]RQV93029.1 MAG: response regulator [bacterium]RQW03881.1 MAG: response regulator [Calditrichota bacterium]